MNSIVDDYMDWSFKDANDLESVKKHYDFKERKYSDYFIDRIKELNVFIKRTLMNFYCSKRLCDMNVIYKLLKDFLDGNNKIDKLIGRILVGHSNWAFIEIDHNEQILKIIDGIKIFGNKYLYVKEKYVNIDTIIIYDKKSGCKIEDFEKDILCKFCDYLKESIEIESDEYRSKTLELKNKLFDEFFCDEPKSKPIEKSYDEFVLNLTKEI